MHVAVPSLPATAVLDYFRTGQREMYEEPWSRRRKMLSTFVLAECLEGIGRFQDAIINTTWAICEETSWELPAHLDHLPNTSDNEAPEEKLFYLPDVTDPLIGLNSAMTGALLAEMDFLLNDSLPNLLKKRIRYETDRRLIEPYLSRNDFWWMSSKPSKQVNNWNAVCNSNIVITTLYLEPDPARQAQVIAKAARSLDEYLVTFDSYGGSSEGVGYWAFGFGNYVLGADLLHYRTQGRIDFFDAEIIPQIARFPLKMVLSPGHFVNFADSDEEVNTYPALLNYLAQKFEIPYLTKLHSSQNIFRDETQGALAWSLRDLFWQPENITADPLIAADHDWYPDMSWLIARYDPVDPDGLVLAAKAGQNDEMHNQNDVGNLIVHLNQESIIADIGRGRYTRDYFSSHRYEHLANQSLGHSVPIPNGQQQLHGRQYAAVVLEQQSNENLDLLSMELKGAYPSAANLATLKRTITMYRDRPKGWVELVDAFEFIDQPHDFTTVLTTFGQIEVQGDSLTIQGERGALQIAFDPHCVNILTDVVSDVDLADGRKAVTRILFTLAVPKKTGTVWMKMQPL